MGDVEEIKTDTRFIRFPIGYMVIQAFNQQFEFYQVMSADIANATNACSAEATLYKSKFGEFYISDVAAFTTTDYKRALRSILESIDMLYLREKNITELLELAGAKTEIIIEGVARFRRIIEYQGEFDEVVIDAEDAVSGDLYYAPEIFVQLKLEFLSAKRLNGALAALDIDAESHE